MITLDALRDHPQTQALVQAATRKKISVIGGGPTGVQFAFEFAARSNKVTLYEARDRLLPTFDASLGITALAAARNMGIEVRLLTEFDPTKDKPADKADLVLFVPGVRATPSFNCDVYGRIEGMPAGTHFYAAGDNSYFSGRGLNTKSAQAAVRKAKHVARTAIADLTGGTVTEYTYPELGYFVSLGPKNAVGYLLSQKTAFHGRAALFMKELIEKQYDLFLAGLPVYP
jgi:NADH dehydrogenase